MASTVCKLYFDKPGINKGGNCELRDRDHVYLAHHEVPIHHWRNERASKMKVLLFQKKHSPLCSIPVYLFHQETSLSLCLVGVATKSQGKKQEGCLICGAFPLFWHGKEKTPTLEWSLWAECDGQWEFSPQWAKTRTEKWSGYERTKTERNNTFKHFP